MLCASGLKRDGGAKDPATFRVTLNCRWPPALVPPAGKRTRWKVLAARQPHLYRLERAAGLISGVPIHPMLTSRSDAFLLHFKLSMTGHALH